jgi:aspartate 1-decarboxylase
MVHPSNNELQPRSISFSTTKAGVIHRKILERSAYELFEMRCLLRAKIHRAVVTDANPEYVGSITIDDELLQKVDIWPGEKVLVADVDNGARFETYVVSGRSGSGIICVNGSAAKLVHKGDKLIIMAYEYTDSPITAKVALVDEKNHFVRSL